MLLGWWIWFDCSSLLVDCVLRVLLVGFGCALFDFGCCLLVWLGFNSVVLNLLGLLLLVCLRLVCL